MGVLKITVLSLMLTLAGCGQEDVQLKHKVQYYFGESALVLSERAGLDINTHVDRQPAGINFYKGRYPLDDLGSITVYSGGRDFTVYHALSFMASADADDAEQIISNFSFDWSYNDQDDQDHDEARRYVYQFFQELLSKGWRAFALYDNPRLIGRESYRYAHETAADSVALDPAYEFTLDEWMALDSKQYWGFINDEAYLVFRIFRDDSRTVIGEPTGYLFSIVIQPLDEIGKLYAGPRRRNEWQKHWVETIKAEKAKRYQIEAELEAQGYYINRQYVEPVIHPKDPVEPD